MSAGRKNDKNQSKPYIWVEMDTAGLKSKRIAQLVEENHIHAYVLYYYGIHFSHYSEHTLEQVCYERGLRVEQVIKDLESQAHQPQEQPPLNTYPVDLILEYLRHAHYHFIKEKLPYISRLVADFQAGHDGYKMLERDLKVVFPLFVEDFIHHIYEEEDTLFTYIQVLDKAVKGQYHPARLFYMLENNSVQRFALEHEAHDDEMEGIRHITNNYHLTTETPLPVKVIFRELQDFEKNLIVHARVENEILFPKALALEAKVKQLFFERSRNN
ncbi:MAG: iron-sulfur cluster repair di-iron protein [Cyclobacteriaceae bacterium]|nr:iron-sulfur cluster repair di-iron protein [Cyclobacteriaceae bacterium]MCX7637283.1 iron-sulfur cluster repair di-iron protein [Cyclobacteriaceae bacterium]MDW8331260.1 iron-sulfur cluster repair di-iron protein [Cyclobacteriaceae bacterium]